MRLVVEGPSTLVVPDEWIGAWLTEHPSRVTTTGYAGIPKCAYNWCVGSRVPYYYVPPEDLFVSGDHYLIIHDGAHERSTVLLDLVKALDYPHTEVLLPPGWHWSNGEITPIS